MKDEVKSLSHYRGIEETMNESPEDSRNQPILAKSSPFPHNP